MNYKDLFKRVIALISSPAKVWEEIGREEDRRKVLGAFVYPMIGLCGLSVFIGTFIGNTEGVAAFQIAMTRCEEKLTRYTLIASVIIIVCPALIAAVFNELSVILN